MALAEMYNDLEDYDKALSWLSRYPEEAGNESYIESVRKTPIFSFQNCDYQIFPQKGTSEISSEILFS
jgi:hypothetical protein